MPENLILAVLADGPDLETASELAGTARRIGDADNDSAFRTGVVILGSQVGDAASSLAELFDDVFVFDDPSLEPADGEVFGQVLIPLIERENPLCVLFPHSNNGMDLAPVVAIRTGRPLVTDCLSVALENGVLRATRPAYGGRIHVDVTASKSETGYMATVRPGAAATSTLSGSVHRESLPDDLRLRRRVIETVAPEAGAIDISQADRIVSVGRGIEDEDNMNLIESLAEALGAEVACSRPIVDKQWLAKSRQVGTSGVTVRPSVYVAVGISGSFQHVGGIKGSPFLVAINKDPRAPIFDIADVGIVGDLFEIVPLLDEKIRALKM